MLEKLLRLYVMSMEQDVRSPMVHIVGPPGCGKSTFVEQLAELVGKELHILNVSRLSPLETEGVQFPHGTGDDMLLKMLPATYWTSLKDGDILFLDEFLRGFPEVYSGLLDIFTSRRVGAFRLPRVFIVAASNSVTAYDQALEDRLLHLSVPDPRKSKSEKKRMGEVLIEALGLMPQMNETSEMLYLLDNDVLPMFGLLDSFGKKGQKVTVKGSTEGRSLRNLIGQAQLRMVQSTDLKELIEENNRRAMRTGKWQYVLLLSGKNVPAGYEANAKKLVGNLRLTPVQASNLALNLQLVEMERAKIQKEEDDD